MLRPPLDTMFTRRARQPASLWAIRSFLKKRTKKVFLSFARADRQQAYLLMKVPKDLGLLPASRVATTLSDGLSITLTVLLSQFTT